MFRLFNIPNIPKKLTEHSNHLIDWSRIGSLFQSASQRYTKEQLITRGIIASCTAVSGYLGYYFNNEEKTGSSNLTIAIASGFLGFTLSHAVVVYPLFKKRNEMRKECKKLKEQIIQFAQNNLFDHFDKINDVVNAILKHSLSDEHRSRASETWGQRKSLLVKFHAALQSDNPLTNCLDRDVNSIINYLNESQLNDLQNNNTPTLRLK